MDGDVGVETPGALGRRVDVCLLGVSCWGIEGFSWVLMTRVFVLDPNWSKHF